MGRRLPPEKIVPTLGLAIGPVLDLEPVLAILTIQSGLAFGDYPFEVPSADFREQFFSCALDMLSIQQAGTVAHANEFRETEIHAPEIESSSNPVHDGFDRLSICSDREKDTHFTSWPTRWRKSNRLRLCGFDALSIKFSLKTNIPEF